MLLRLVVLLAIWSAVRADESGEEGGERKIFKPPSIPSGPVFIAESFSDSDAVWKRWVKSQAKKEEGANAGTTYNGEWVLEELETDGSLEGDLGLMMKDAAKHYAIAAKLDRLFTFSDNDALVVQYEVNFQNGMSCGGAYLKLLSDDPELASFHDKTPYTIMFGPDKCGTSSKVHFIVRYRNPVSGEVEEKHSKQSDQSMGFFDDKRTHLFTLVIHSTGEYHIIVDQMPFMKGHLLEDLTPPIIPPKEIEDPEDRKPEDWDDREKIADPDAVKPDDWDEDAPAKIVDSTAVKPDGWLDEGPDLIPDPDATQPEDWDEEEDGEWEPPMVPNPACEEAGCGEWTPPMVQNPAYKGKWKAALIDNPNYSGKWEPHKIDNPEFFEDESPYLSLAAIGAVGLELWTMNEGVVFDNVIITSELAVANDYARESWILKKESEREAEGSSMGWLIDLFVDTANTYPWVWAFYALAVVSPFVCCAAFCIKSKPRDEAASRKKTDAPSPDDKEPPPPSSEEQSFVAAAEDEPEEDGKGSVDKGKEEGDGEGEEEGEGEGGGGSQESQGESPAEESQEEQAVAKGEGAAKKTTRKRKARRES